MASALSIRKEIKMCLQCPLPDCAINDDGTCIRIKYQEVDIDRFYNIIQSIKLITRDGPIATKQLRKQLESEYGCTKVIINNMVQSGKLKTKKIGKGRNSIRIIGVINE